MKNRTLGAILLVAGTTIGGGMLALPAVTGKAGFFPSTLMMLFGWAFMTVTALFLIEINLWMEKGAHIITMVGRTLGRPGKWIGWIFFLFISVASLTAYTAGCSDLLQMGARKSLNLSLSPFIASSIFVLLFGFVIYLGNVMTSRINALLMTGLVISYLLMIGGGLPCIEWENLLRFSWGDSLVAAPLLLTIFSFHTMIPSLTIYLDRNPRNLRISCILGTTIAFIVYLIWQALVLGAVLYDGDQGLAAALAQGKAPIEHICASLNSPWLSQAVNFFAFFALVTSFLGLGLGLFDFLADGLKIKPKGGRKILLALMVAIPPLVISLGFERIFILALDISGGLGDTVLNGFLPALMLWVGRYKMKMRSENPIWGGKPLIIGVMVYAVFVFAIEILGKLGIAFRL